MILLSGGLEFEKFGNLYEIVGGEEKSQLWATDLEVFFVRNFNWNTASNINKYCYTYITAFYTNYSIASDANSSNSIATSYTTESSDKIIKSVNGAEESIKQTTPEFPKTVLTQYKKEV